MSNDLPRARRPGVLSRAYGGGLWERGGGCRFTTTPVVQPTCDQYGAMALDAPVGREIQGQRRCRLPTTRRVPIQASPCGMALNTLVVLAQQRTVIGLQT